MNFSECLSNSNKHLFAVKVFYACCLNSADTPASSAARRDQLHFAVRKGEAGRDFSKFRVIIFQPGTRPRVPFPPIAWSSSAACGVSMGGEAAQNSFIEVNLQVAHAASQIFVFLSLAGLAGNCYCPLKTFWSFFITSISCFNRSLSLLYQIEKRCGLLQKNCDSK